MTSFRNTLAATLVALCVSACSQGEPAAPAPAAAPETSAPAEAPPVTVTMPGPPNPVGVPSGADDTCGAEKYAGLVGRPADMPGVPEPGPDFRHIGPDTQVTMDFRENRINMDISAEGVITGFRCG